MRPSLAKVDPEQFGFGVSGEVAQRQFDLFNF